MTSPAMCSRGKTRDTPHITPLTGKWVIYGLYSDKPIYTYYSCRVAGASAGLLRQPNSNTFNQCVRSTQYRPLYATVGMT